MIDIFFAECVFDTFHIPSRKWDINQLLIEKKLKVAIIISRYKYFVMYLPYSHWKHDLSYSYQCIKPVMEYESLFAEAHLIADVICKE